MRERESERARERERNSQGARERERACARDGERDREIERPDIGRQREMGERSAACVCARGCGRVIGW